MARPNRGRRSRNRESARAREPEPEELEWTAEPWEEPETEDGDVGAVVGGPAAEKAASEPAVPELGSAEPGASPDQDRSTVPEEDVDRAPDKDAPATPEAPEDEAPISDDVPREHIDIPPYLIPDEAAIEEHKAARARRGPVRPLWVLLAVLIAEVLIYAFYLYVPAVVNGQNVRIRRGSTVAEVMRQLGISARAGDLLDVRGRVFKKGGGEPPVYQVDGDAVNLGYVVEGGQRVRLADGKTLREPTVRRIELIEGGTKLTGSGSFVVVSDPGRPGIRRIVRGKLSHIVAERRIIRNPRPMVLRRTKQHPTKVVALTFDDGPAPGYTDRVLKILSNRHVVATFFVLGQKAQRYPALARREAQAGHIVGSHSFNHLNLVKLSQEALERDFDVTTRSIQTATKRRPHWFRPPYGSTNMAVLKTAAAQHYRTVMWDVDPGDWRRPGWKIIYGRVMAAARPGAVILLHDGGGDRSQTVMALPRIIDGLRRKGYSFVTVSQLGVK